MELALEAGAEDVKAEGSEFEVITEPAAFEAVKKAIDAKGIKHLEASHQQDSFQYREAGSGQGGVHAETDGEAGRQR